MARNTEAEGQKHIVKLHLTNDALLVFTFILSLSIRFKADKRAFSILAGPTWCSSSVLVVEHNMGKFLLKRKTD